MLMTEAEARERWCPHARLPWFEPARIDEEAGEIHPRFVIMAAVNLAPSRLHERHTPVGRCLASDCMFWRWISRAHEKASGPGMEAVRYGYCGAAGKPEVG